MTFTIMGIGATILMGFLSLIFKVGGKLRLTLPIAYLLIAVISTFFTDWTTKNEQYILYGLYILIGLVTLSWIWSLVKKLRSKKQEHYTESDAAWQIRQAQEMSVPLDNVTFDKNGSLIDPRTGQPVVYGDGVKFIDI